MKGKNTSNNRQLLIKVLIRFVLAIIILGFNFFLPAGSIKFWEAWVYMGILFTPMIFVLIYLLKKDPELLERRMKIKEKEEPQKVISTGPYAIIRHPMYVAVLTMYILSPLALGSYWAVLAILPLPVLVVFRIENEEKILIDKLPGYRVYAQKVKYRLIPYIW